MNPILEGFSTGTQLMVVENTAADWALYNPKLKKFEIGRETETGQTKTGDGVTRWNSLRYSGRTPTELAPSGLPYISGYEVVDIPLVVGASGNNDIYTVPAGKKALIPNFWLRNVTAGAITRTQNIKISGTYYRLFVTGQSTTANNLTLIATFYVANAGETFSLNFGSVGVNVGGNAWLFPDTHPLKTVRLNNLNLSNQTVYTVPPGKKAFHMGSIFPASQNGGVLIANDSGVSHTVTLYHVPSGSSASSANQVFNGAIATGSFGAANLPSLWLAGDSIVAVSTSATAGCFTWVNVYETDI